MERLWYRGFPWLLPLWPLELLFSWLARRRRTGYAQSEQQRWQPPVPVVVVGNISVGGVGKTPVVIALVELLKQAGYSPGVVSRGYGGKAETYPFRVTVETGASICGDEPLMIANRCGCPVVIDPDRQRACKELLQDKGVDVIVADDGLQHYAMNRHLEIAVVDGERGLGNGHCLPVGPLREPPGRLDECDFVLINGDGWQRPDAFRFQLQQGSLMTLSGEAGTPDAMDIHAVAGIGNPMRFFRALETLGYKVTPHPFPDHHGFAPDDLQYGDDRPVIMTEKDAVKCRAFGQNNRYYLPVDAVLPQEFVSGLLQRLRQVSSDMKATQ